MGDSATTGEHLINGAVYATFCGCYTDATEDDGRCQTVPTSRRVFMVTYNLGSAVTVNAADLRQRLAMTYDGDGVYDEFEIAGCHRRQPCNYNPRRYRR